MNEVVHTSPTIGSNVEEIVVKNTHFLMWDIGGQESLRSSWNTYYSNTEVSGTISGFTFFSLSRTRGAEVLSGSQCVCVQFTDVSRGCSGQRLPLEQRCLSEKQGGVTAETDAKNNPLVQQPANPSVSGRT